MKSTSQFRNVCAVLGAHERKWHIQDNDEREHIASDRKSVFKRFGPVFSAANVGHLKKKDFEAFLLFKNNLHWTGLHRRGPTICADMPALRRGLTQLLDTRQPLAERYDKCDATVRGMGKAISTAILMVSSGGNYGIWNNRSEETLRSLGLWPKFPNGTTDGKRYAFVNDALKVLAKDLRLDLWYLDTVLWHFQREESGALESEESEILHLELPNDLADTVRKATVETRRGQEKFRNALIVRWGGCSVTGIQDAALLRASHIKPWNACEADERLDPDNGLLLTPNLDHLLDKGYITFEDDGRIRISRALTEQDLRDLGVKATMKLRKVHAESATYLEYHRENVFKG